MKTGPNTGVFTIDDATGCERAVLGANRLGRNVTVIRQPEAGAHDKLYFTMSDTNTVDMMEHRAAFLEKTRLAR